MKKIKIFLIILLAVFSYRLSIAQTLKNRANSVFTQKDERLAVGRNFYIPYGTSTGLNGGLNRIGGLYFNTSTGNINIYNGTTWKPLALEEGFVPYVGATSNLNLGSYGVYVGGLARFDGNVDVYKNDFEMAFNSVTGYQQFGKFSIDTIGGVKIKLTTAQNTQTLVFQENDGPTSFGGVISSGDSISVLGKVTGKLTLKGKTSGSVALTVNDVAGSNKVILLPAASGTVALTSGHTDLDLPLTGGALTGDLSIVKSSPVITLDGTNKTGYLRYRFNGATQWLLGKSVNGVQSNNYGLYHIPSSKLVFDIDSATALFSLSNDFLIGGSNATKASGTTWTNPSDVRLKTNIQNYTKGIAELKQIRPVTYQFNEASGLDTTKTNLSIIAQEIEQVLPGTVSEYVGKLNGVDTTLKKFDASEITWLLVNALKEAVLRIEALEAR